MVPPPAPPSLACLTLQPLSPPGDTCNAGRLPSVDVLESCFKISDFIHGQVLPQVVRAPSLGKLLIVLSTLQSFVESWFRFRHDISSWASMCSKKAQKTNCIFLFPLKPKDAVMKGQMRREEGVLIFILLV